MNSHREPSLVLFETKSMLRCRLAGAVSIISLIRSMSPTRTTSDISVGGSVPLRASSLAAILSVVKGGTYVVILPVPGMDGNHSIFCISG